MKILIYLVSCLLNQYVSSEIRGSVIVNKILSLHDDYQHKPRVQTFAPTYNRKTKKEIVKLTDDKLKKVKPVGNEVKQNFVPLTEIPPPSVHRGHGRRHLEQDCTKKPEWQEVHGGPKIEIIGDYYEEDHAKTVATVVIPDHIDYKHFEITTQIPYLTVGLIEAIGYHPRVIKSEHPSECEKIYQDHLEEQYSEESDDYSEESMEVARMPLFPGGAIPDSDERKLENIYSDLD
ncbi:uncharacterized protein LOC106718199 [Papilio machaon]|uniref:uncharacterized protein LOC106718199 n=1 Tax=Papilio machaon TaxID=76193 RepID=UPI001E6645CF|nr:uncharacterized protein LOC106718199 [Papilio machaon]